MMIGMEWERNKQSAPSRPVHLSHFVSYHIGAAATGATNNANAVTPQSTVRARIFLILKPSSEAKRERQTQPDSSDKEEVAATRRRATSQYKSDNAANNHGAVHCGDSRPQLSGELVIFLVENWVRSSIPSFSISRNSLFFSTHLPIPTYLSYFTPVLPACSRIHR
jgi:hypothetical protein